MHIKLRVSKYVNVIFCVIAVIAILIWLICVIFGVLSLIGAIVYYDWWSIIVIPFCDIMVNRWLWLSSNASTFKRVKRTISSNHKTSPQCDKNLRIVKIATNKCVFF